MSGAVTFRYTFESDHKAKVFSQRVNLRLGAATLRDEDQVHVVVPREDIRELDRLAMASSAAWKMPGVWV